MTYQVINKSSKSVAKIRDPEINTYFYNVNRDAFTFGFDAEKTTHIIKVDAGLTAQELDVILDDVFFDYLIEHGTVGGTA